MENYIDIINIEPPILIQHSVHQLMKDTYHRVLPGARLFLYFDEKNHWLAKKI